MAIAISIDKRKKSVRMGRLPGRLMRPGSLDNVLAFLPGRRKPDTCLCDAWPGRHDQFGQCRTAQGASTRAVTL
jgi:hypothetical protein